MNSLLATLVICMGMSNGMPVSDYNKKQIKHETKTEIQPKYASTDETQINEYTLTAPYTNYIETNFANDKVGLKSNIANNNSYINVLGNTYNQQTRITNPTTQAQYSLVATYNYFENNENDINNTEKDKINRLGYILKLTPYNYNINTEATITINFKLLANESGYRSLHVRYRIYQTIDNWDEYINKQLTASIVDTIETDIRDPNNNYYYNYTTETNEIDINTQSQYSKDITLTLTPNKDNFVFISLTPLYEWNDDPNDPVMEQAEYVSVIRNAFPIEETGNLIINGTNIIPPSSYEVIDLPGLMFEVLGMPFAFISQAFGLTLFPGTPYQINISNLFLAIIATLVFVFLIKIIVKVSSKG